MYYDQAKNFGVNPIPSQRDGVHVPQNPFLKYMPFPRKAFEHRVAKFDTLTYQGQTVNTHYPPHPAAQFFTRVISIVNCYAEF